MVSAGGTAAAGVSESSVEIFPGVGDSSPFVHVSVIGGVLTASV